MNTMTIMANPGGGGERDIPIEINLGEVNFVAKQALHPWMLVMTGAQFPVEVIDEQILRDAGMIELDTPEGAKAFLNVEKVLGYFSPQLGTYVFVFNGTQLIVKATREEVETKLRVHKTLATPPIIGLIGS
jgi:hypothetical protein